MVQEHYVVNLLIWLLKSIYNVGSAKESREKEEKESFNHIVVNVKIIPRA